MTDKLMKVAVIGGFTVGFTGYALRYSIQEKLRKSKYYQEAMSSMRKHPEAIKHLGEPITDSRVNVGDIEDYGSNNDSSWVTIPVKGPKNSGKLRYWVMQKNDDIYVSRIELMITNIKDKKLLIKNVGNVT